VASGRKLGGPGMYWDLKRQKKLALWISQYSFRFCKR